MKTNHQMPILGASVAVFRHGKVLLIQRGKEPGRGLWSLPGGRVEFGESLQGAALRELAEEAGLAVQIRGFVGVYEVIAAEFHSAICCYAALSETGEPKAGSDAADAGFFAFDELTQLLLAPNIERAISDARVILSI